jgi:predicted naringenin-chalcone synthase
LAIAIETDSSPDLLPELNGRTLFTRRTASLLGVQVVGCGSYVPDNVVTNSDLNQRFGFDANWIEQRTGIRERRHCPEGMATSDLAVEAARRAIRAAHVDPQEIDLLVVGTFTPDYQCPSTACIVQDHLGLDCPALTPRRPAPVSCMHCSPRRSSSLREIRAAPSSSAPTATAAS